ncbi:MAG: 2-amino-4-hydroxy-6-hydroxymethyldihydropteridine diphosphokinase [Steroidobacteraceae bacterium]
MASLRVGAAVGVVVAVVAGVAVAPGPDSARWVPAYVGLGSNLGDSVALIGQAIERLDDLELTRVVCRSGLYRTAPFGPIEQQPFVNAVVGVLTLSTPMQLLQRLLEIEQGLGRRRDGERWGPRHIDLDLLVHGEARLEAEGLRVPHPGIPERDFVLYPLLEIAPHLSIPGLGVVRALASRVVDRGVQRLR